MNHTAGQNPRVNHSEGWYKVAPVEGQRRARAGGEHVEFSEWPSPWGEAGSPTLRGLTPQ